MNFYQLLENKKKRLLDTALDSLKTASKKVVHQTSEFLGNKIADEIVKPKHVIDENPKNVEEIIILQEKRKILNELRQVL